MAPRIAAIGEITEDVYLPENDRTLGGISANFAYHAAALGARVSLYAPIGDDATGRRLRDILCGLPIDAHLAVLPGATARQRIRLQPDGERLFDGFAPGVLVDYRLCPADLADLTAFDVLAVVFSAETRASFTQILDLPPTPGQARVADFSQDSAPAESDPEDWIAPYLDRLAVAFVGGRTQHAPILRALSATVDTVLVLTAGADGSYAFNRGAASFQPSLATRITDTTGCGDAFQAGFVVAWTRSASLDEALRAGARRAAAVAAHKGATIPPGALR